MSIKSSYFVPTTTNFGIGQKFITINVGDKSYSFPIVFSQGGNNVDFSEYFYHQSGVSTITGNNVKIQTSTNGLLQVNASDLIFNGANINEANGLVKLNNLRKIPNQFLDINLENTDIVAVSYNSTITLPIPYDKENECVTLIIDFIPYENQEQIVQFNTQYINYENIDVTSDNPFGQVYTSKSSVSSSSWLSYDQNGYGRSFYRISMAEESHRQYMWVYNKDKFVKIQSPSLIVSSYGQNITVTLNNNILPGYTPGKTYFARYTWMDVDGGFMDWKGFKFSGDVVEMAFPQNNLEEQISIYQFENTVQDTDIDGIITLPQFDYLNGEIQKFTLGGATTIDVDNIYNIPYGKSLKLLINTSNNQLNLKNQLDQNEVITASGRYLIEIQNFSQHIISYKKIL